MTKLIFLDIDGVMNSAQFIQQHPEKEIDELIDPLCVARLNNILEQTGAKIVLSSSWRISFIDEPDGLQKCQEFFSKFGIHSIIGMTPKLYKQLNVGFLVAKPRSAEIIAWLDKYGKDVSNFIVIDDDVDANVKNRFIKTWFEFGLTDEKMELAIKMLNER